MKTNDPLSIGFSERQINWIFEQADDRREADTSKQKREIIEQYMQESSKNAKEMKALQLQSDSALVTDEELKWVESNDSRLLKWIAFYCLNSTSFWLDKPDPLWSTIEPKIYSNFILSLDCWKETLENKSVWLNKLNSDWCSVKSQDKKLSWLNKDNNFQMEWAWSYVNEYYKEDRNSKAFSFRFNPTTTEDIHCSILSIFDTWLSHPYELQKLQTALKKAWAQQKFRAKLSDNHKKQSTYVLSEVTINYLRELAERKNVNINQMLEHIINKAYKKSTEGNFKKNPKKNNTL